jgi:hypothetical protein
MDGIWSCRQTSTEVRVLAAPLERGRSHVSRRGPRGQAQDAHLGIVAAVDDDGVDLGAVAAVLGG